MVGEFFVRHRLSVRYVQESLPHLPLKRAPRKFQGHGELLQGTLEIPGEFISQGVEHCVAARHYREFEDFPQRRKLCFEHPSLGELQQDEVVVCGAGNQGAQRALDPGDEDAIGLSCLPWRRAECPAESFPETAMGFIAMAERDVVELAAFANLFKCLTHSSPSAICLKGHPKVLLKIPPGAGRINAHAANLAVRNPAAGRAVHPRE